MKSIDSDLVKSCWSIIKDNTSDLFFIETFYEILFERYPDTRHLFSASMANQNLVIRNKLDNVINGIEHIHKTEPSLIKLGETHKNLGITPEMYNMLVESIVEAATIASNNSLNDAELSEWEKAFRKISDIMLKAY